jgi:hypothetical protein
LGTKSNYILLVEAATQHDEPVIVFCLLHLFCERAAMLKHALCAPYYLLHCLFLILP